MQLLALLSMILLFRTKQITSQLCEMNYLFYIFLMFSFTIYIEKLEITELEYLE